MGSIALPSHRMVTGCPGETTPSQDTGPARSSVPLEALPSIGVSALTLNLDFAP